MHQDGGSGPLERIRICLQKPTAVILADAPAVEVLVDSDPGINAFTRELLAANVRNEKPPFPLRGRLDVWIQENGMEGVERRTSC